jgi:hypothetical protein
MYYNNNFIGKHVAIIGPKFSGPPGCPCYIGITLQRKISFKHKFCSQYFSVCDIMCVCTCVYVYMYMRVYIGVCFSGRAEIMSGVFPVVSSYCCNYGYVLKVAMIDRISLSLTSSQDIRHRRHFLI